VSVTAPSGCDLPAPLEHAGVDAARRGEVADLIVIASALGDPAGLISVGSTPA
jgi:hypothetical protein